MKSNIFKRSQKVALSVMPTKLRFFTAALAPVARLVAWVQRKKKMERFMTMTDIISIIGDNYQCNA